MPASEARISANRQNALRSTGPKTPEGKERSRANSLKHGLTGEGVVLSPQDAAEVALRAGELEGELRPSGRMGRILVQRIAVISVRLDRSVEHEFAAVAENVRHAQERFDDDRARAREIAFDWIASEPSTHARRLRTTHEGIDRLIQAYHDLEADLDRPGVVWAYGHWQRLENLEGRRSEEFPQTRAEALSKVLWGNNASLEPGEADGMDKPALDAWARDGIRAVVREGVERLRALRETIDVGAIEQDRREAGSRALFDPSGEATLARKYEAAAERGLYRALRELREVEATAREVEATPDPAGDSAALGSFFPDAPAPEGARPKASARRPSGPIGRPSGRIGRPRADLEAPKPGSWTAPVAIR